jgi:hypothetical protein
MPFDGAMAFAMSILQHGGTKDDDEEKVSLGILSGVLILRSAYGLVNFNPYFTRYNVWYLDVCRALLGGTESGIFWTDLHVIPKIPPGWYLFYQLQWFSTWLISSSTMIWASLKVRRIGTTHTIIENTTSVALGVVFSTEKYHRVYVFVW